MVEVEKPAPAQWLARHGEALYRFALRRVPAADCAEELVQETLLSALHALGAFRGQASERTWLFAILRRKIIDHYRRQARSPLVPLEPRRAAPAPAFFRPGDGHWREETYPQAWNVPAEDVQTRQELRQTLQQCLDQLPARHGAVFILRFVEERSAEEICRQLRLSPANYWVLVHRAKLHLRKCLEIHWFGKDQDSELT